MKVFYCTDHATFWPVGGASVVVARGKARAEELLKNRLKSMGLDARKPFTLHGLSLDHERAVILQDPAREY